MTGAGGAASPAEKTVIASTTVASTSTPTVESSGATIGFTRSRTCRMIRASTSAMTNQTGQQP